MPNEVLAGKIGTPDRLGLTPSRLTFAGAHHPCPASRPSPLGARKLCCRPTTVARQPTAAAEAQGHHQMRLGQAGHPASLQAAVRQPRAAAAAAPGARPRSRLHSLRPSATAPHAGSGAERRRRRAAAAPPPAETAAAVGEEAPASPPPPSDWAARQQTAAPAAAEATQQQGWSSLVSGLDAEVVGKLCLLMVALLWGSYNPMCAAKQGCACGAGCEGGVSGQPVRAVSRPTLHRHALRCPRRSCLLPAAGSKCCTHRMGRRGRWQ